MKKRFVEAYLASAGLILATTAIGKAIPVHAYNLCIEEPILGSLQINWGFSNSAVLGTASALEFALVLLICFSRRRWLPCLASGLWGVLCVFVRLFFLGTLSCNCLGWFQHIIPLPEEVLNSILLVFATWLAVGGFVAFGLNSMKMEPWERKGALATAIILLAVLAMFLHYFPTAPVSPY